MYAITSMFKDLAVVLSGLAGKFCFLGSLLLVKSHFSPLGPV